MAHELGHILLHPWGEETDDLPKEEFNGREKQANMFASALLLPRDSFGILCTWKFNFGQIYTRKINIL